jgi:hypothetical protein
MAIINKTDDQLGNTQNAGFSTQWDWKGDYVSPLKEDGLERFSQFSATPDSTIIFAGPARFTGLSGDTASLLPIGLVDGISYQSTPQLQRLFEIGSNRSFFTRGKSISSISFSKMLADQANILKALSLNVYRPDLNIDGPKAPGADAPNPDIMLNLDSEYFNVPFGLMLLFKTRGGSSGNGKILSAIYLEYCMFSSYNFSIAAQAPVIMENIAIEFDRTVPVSLTN